MSTAVVTLSLEGTRLAERLVRKMPNCTVYVHEDVDSPIAASFFRSVIELTAAIFSEYSSIIYITPSGVAVRAVAPCLKHKTVDPAVVVVDVLGRWAISLVSGHEGGANDLAVLVSNILHSEPVISTTSEALKTIIVGIGCRKGATADRIIAAVDSALAIAQLNRSQVRLLSSADIKSDEQGLLEAARVLGIPLRFISSEEIRNCVVSFRRSNFVHQRVNLPAVAEPCALLAGRRTTLLLRKTIYNGVTVAIARESFLS